MPKTRPTASLPRIDDYAEAVLTGDIVAGPWVRHAARRHFDDLKVGHERGLWFDKEAAQKSIDFFEELLFLSEGQFEGKPFILDPSQVFKVGSLFGWKREDGARRFRRAYVEEGKGNGKSPLAGGIGLIGLCADGEQGAQVYAAAAKREQAEILFRDAVKMRDGSRELKKRLGTYGGVGRETRIYHQPSGSFFAPVSREAGKTGSGPRPSHVLADEIHELPDRGILEMLERGFKFRRNPLLFMITNSGFDRTSVCWEEHVLACKVVSGNVAAPKSEKYVGEIIDDSMFCYVCSLDKGDDPLNDPSCWAKANPLLGVTITEDYLADVVRQAKNTPGRMNSIKRLHFCEWTTSDADWLSDKLVDAVLKPIDREAAKGCPLYVGLDLSQRDDFNAVACIADTPDGLVAWADSWACLDGLQERADRDNVPYLEWLSQGVIKATDGPIIDMLAIARHLQELSQDYDLRIVAYDNYKMRDLRSACDEIGLELPFVQHPQAGTKVKGTKSDLLTEQLWMPRSMKVLENLIVKNEIEIEANAATQMALMSPAIREDAIGNQWMEKGKSLNKIDALIALCMAAGAMDAFGSAAPSKSPWDDPNFRLAANG